MSKKLLILFCVLILAFAVTSVADREASGESKLTMLSPGITESGEWEVKADSRAIVWDNGMTYIGIAASQYDVQTVPILDPIVADDFEFAVDQQVNDVHWIGGYWNGPPDDGDFDWEIIFYDDFGDGTKPGAVIATYTYPNASVNETWLSGTPGDMNFYGYSVDLSSTLTFFAGTKYWISIQGIGVFPPQSGVAYHTDQILLHEAVFKSDYFGFPDWTNGADVFGLPINLCFQLTYEETTECTWNPGDDHKMHFPQLPDETGWAVNATQPLILADDFLCMQTGWIKDVHWWGAWMNGLEGEVLSFVLSLHSDIPADQSPTGYSMPGITLWEVEIPGFPGTPVDPPTMEGWYDPAQGLIISDDHQAYFQYDVCLDEQYWFWQDSNTIYWLNISAIVEDPGTTQWGWKSTQDHWNDDAVYAFWGNLDWQELYEPASADTLANDFYIAIDPMGTFLGGGGAEAYGDGWYFYPQEEWWNIWFWDHYLDYNRVKRGFIEFDVFPVDPGQPGYFEIAVNWATDQWTLDFPEDSMPPLPGVDEALYIGRTTLFADDFYEGHYILPYEILDYNPEWVSVDVRGYNFDIPVGIIIHSCESDEQVSLDLAFVITGEPPGLDSGACCFDDGSCTDTDQNDCETVQGGIWQGAGTACEGDIAPANGIDDACETGPFGACCFQDGSCLTLSAADCANQSGTWDATQPCQGDVAPANGIDDACETGPFGACCFTDGSCNDLSQADCANQSGDWKGVGTVCLGDGDMNGIDDACEDPEPEGACCFTDGNCVEMTEAECDAGSGDYRGDYSNCLGDADANGVDDACEAGWIPGDEHKMHYPQLPDEAGWDVNATYPMFLADDWRCSQTGWIKDFHFWGSWKHGNTGEITSFILNIHRDIPAYQSPTGYSMPADSVWSYEIFDFSIVPYDPPTMEGWYDPATGDTLYDDHQEYFQYNIILHDSTMWFWQEQDSIYWLSISANVEDPTGQGPQWGWKSSINHFNDDAVWRLPGVPNWIELYEPGIQSDPITNGFMVQFDEQGMFLDGYGEDAFGEGWYYYPWYDWWNVWFYDHPFAPERYKTVHIEFDIVPTNPTAPAWVEIAVNWSTDIWSIEQPPGDSAPPLPGVDEDLYIGREILWASDYPEGHYFVDYIIPDYNPEWISVDVRGFNFFITDGFITHDCVGQQSLDLSFVVTGDMPCDCVPGNANGDAATNILDVTYLIAFLYKGGPAPTPYALCSGDPDCNCTVNILDVTYLIAYLYKGGPPPCTCQQWLTACGPPLRK